MKRNAERNNKYDETKERKYKRKADRKKNERIIATKEYRNERNLKNKER